MHAAVAGDEDGGGAQEAAAAAGGEKKRGAFSIASRLGLTALWVYVYLYDPDSIYGFTICIIVCYVVLSRYSQN